MGVQTEMIGNNETYKKKCYSLSLHLLDFSPLCLFINSQPFLATTLDPKYVAILFSQPKTLYLHYFQVKLNMKINLIKIISIMSAPYPPHPVAVDKL